MVYRECRLLPWETTQEPHCLIGLLEETGPRRSWPLNPQSKPVQRLNDSETQKKSAQGGASDVHPPAQAVASAVGPLPRALQCWQQKDETTNQKPARSAGNPTSVFPARVTNMRNTNRERTMKPELVPDVLRPGKTALARGRGYGLVVHQSARHCGWAVDKHMLKPVTETWASDICVKCWVPEKPVKIEPS